MHQRNVFAYNKQTTKFKGEKTKVKQAATIAYGNFHLFVKRLFSPYFSVESTPKKRKRKNCGSLSLSDCVDSKESDEFYYGYYKHDGSLYGYCEVRSWFNLSIC